MMVAACTIATMNGRGANVVISQPAPVFCNQVPSQTTTLANHSVRNVALRSGTRAGGSRMMRSLQWVASRYRPFGRRSDTVACECGFDLNRPSVAPA